MQFRQRSSRTLVYRSISFVAILIVGIGNSFAHEGDHNVATQLRARYAGQQYAVAAPETLTAVRQIASAMKQVHNESGAMLLPAGTAVDAVRWQDRVLHVHLTLDATRQEWQLTPLDLESLNRAIATPFQQDGRFAGAELFVRATKTDEHARLADFLQIPREEAGQRELPADADVIIPQRTDNANTQGIGGPTPGADRQPTGALTGVTVYVSAGHGWTAGASAWALQRPVLLGMAEDYGNIDQLNYFVQYCFNAGATVVPLRPAGWQPAEILIDQDDAEVSYTGAWSSSFNPKYFEDGTTVSGVAYEFATADATETATARYTPTIPASDFYPVYCFAIASSNRVRQTYRISHDGGISEIVVDHRNVGNGWVWLGDYYLQAGGDNWVEISNQSPDSGVVIADGIRWGGGMGDIVRPGPGSISGYPRDEEAQRYWAEHVYSDNGVGFSSSIWDNPSLSDLSDNIGAGARMAREMNVVPAGGVQVDRFKRVHVEFHTNAFDGNARGQLCLITNTGATTNQASFATILSDEIDADLDSLESEFEHNWVDRFSPTLTGAYGAISTGGNSNEFDATLVEFAFHDNDDDAELLRDSRVRAAMARATTHGIIRFLNGLAGSTVPLAFAPDRPRDFSVIDIGGGDVQLSWIAPLSDGARGDPATGYVIYQSDNGLGFGDPIVLGNVLTHTISGVAPGETRYFRIAATNAGGESMPTETLAARRASDGSVGNIIVVNGFDRLRRQMNPIQQFTQPPFYNGLQVERQKWRESNAYNYIIEHAHALIDNDLGFSSCANEAVIDSLVQLGNYDFAIWILGMEANEDATFNATEQTRVTDFLTNGGGLFATGGNIGFDLINQGTGASFALNTLNFAFSSNDSNSTTVTPTAGGIFAGMANFNFALANGAPYDVRDPDVLNGGSDGLVALNYVGGIGGGAAVQFTGDVYNTVIFGFPFEAITSASARADVLQRVLNFLETATGPLPFDFDNDGDVDFNDFQGMLFCLQGPDVNYAPGNFCLEFSDDDDNDVDIRDFADLQAVFTGPL